MSYIQKRGKNTSWREGLMRNLATELIIHGRLLVTETRAKQLRSVVEDLITLSKRQNLHAIRQADSILRNINVNDNVKKDVNETALQKLFGSVAKKYQKRDGGYTRILKTENRRGDNAPMVYIELV